MPETGICLLFSAAHPQKGVLGFPSKKTSGVLDSKPKSGGGNGRQGASSKATPKKVGKEGTAANSQGSSTPSASQTSPHHSGWGTSHQCKSKKDDGEKWKKAAGMSPTRKSRGHKTCKDGARH